MNCKGTIIFVVCMVCAISARAQYTSRLGRFQVDQRKGCAPLTITITVNAPFQCDNSNPCAAFYDFANNPQVSEPLITPPFTHTYAAPGTYTLSVLMGTLMDDIVIEVAPDTPPAFDVFTCGNNEVSVVVTDNSYNQYVINYNDGSPDVVVPAGNLAIDRHVFASSGPKTITVRGRNLNAHDNCTPATRNITALATLPTPSIDQLRVTDNATVVLDLNTQPDIQYRLEIATSSATAFQLLKTVYNSSTETISNIRPEDTYYCFRIGAHDPCNNQTFYSPTICSANFDLSIQNNVNHVTWSTSAAGISNFRLTRTDQGGSITTTPGGSPYADIDVVCGTQYCYQLVINYPNGSRSVSLEKCGTAISTDKPPAILNTTVIVGDGGAAVEWQAAPNTAPDQFQVYKIAGGSVVLLDTTSGFQTSDPAYETEQAACYQVAYRDRCGNQSDHSAEACPIRLTAELQNDNTVVLSWTAYSGWQNGVLAYTLEKYSQEGQLVATYALGSGLTFTDDVVDLNHQANIYVVRAQAVQGGLPAALSNRLTVARDPNLFYPTGFTPNGDNLNDIFNVYGHYITTFEMNIFNRWGELMYTTTDLEQGWDGNFRGNPMPEGTYTFVASITDRIGRTFKKSGSVLLLRKGK